MFHEGRKMKAFKFVNVMAIGLALAFVSSGCKHKPVGVTSIPGRTGGAPQDIGGVSPLNPDNGLGGLNNGGLNGQNNLTGIPQNTPGHVGWKHDESTLSAHTVYFAYDSSVVKTGEKSKVAAVADYLKSSVAAAVEVDGHCDERGTEEYNRSLGE